MGRGAWWAAVHGVTKSRTQLSDFTFTFHFHATEKETATHSSVLAWRIPRTGEPGGLPSMGSHRVGHDWSDLAAAAAAHRKDCNKWFHIIISMEKFVFIWLHLIQWSLGPLCWCKLFHSFFNLLTNLKPWAKMGRDEACRVRGQHPETRSRVQKGAERSWEGTKGPLNSSFGRQEG